MTVGLADILSSFDARRRAVTVYGRSPAPDLAERFADWNVTFEYRSLPDAADTAFATVRSGEEFLGSVDLAALSAARDPTLRAVGRSDPDGTDLGPFLDLFERTLFHSETRRDLLAASREFEDRAHRVGEGTLHAGFQRPAAIEAQREPYERLAGTGLDVHVYFAGDWPDEPISGVTGHTAENGELDRYWFVCFDPPEAPDATDQSCVLLAEEREARTYTGFWSYDRADATAVADYLATTYATTP